MPAGTAVDKIYQALRRKGYDADKAARIAQAQTGEALATGRKSKGQGMSGGSPLFYHNINGKPVIAGSKITLSPSGVQLLGLGQEHIGKTVRLHQVRHFGNAQWTADRNNETFGNTKSEAIKKAVATPQGLDYVEQSKSTANMPVGMDQEPKPLVQRVPKRPQYTSQIDKELAGYRIQDPTSGKKNERSSLPPGMRSVGMAARPKRQRQTVDLKQFIKGLRPGSNIISVAHQKVLLPGSGLLQKYRKNAATGEHYRADPETGKPMEATKAFPKGVFVGSVARYHHGISYENYKRKKIAEEAANRGIDPAELEAELASKPPAKENWVSNATWDPEHKGLLSYTGKGGTREYLFLMPHKNKQGKQVKDRLVYADMDTGRQLTPDEITHLHEGLVSGGSGDSDFRIIPTENIHAISSEGARGFKLVNPSKDPRPKSQREEL